MTEAVQVAIIATVGVSVPVVGTIATLFINRWFKKMDEKIDKYHKEVDGKMTELLKVTAASEKAKGKLEGRDELKNEQENGKH